MPLERYLVEFSAPTLASLKAASLFSLPCESEEELSGQLAEWSRVLAPKGVSLTVLRRDGGRAVIYVYRRTHLIRDLRRPGVGEFLARQGYSGAGLEQALSLLRARMARGGDFPHEIGLFLGYPLEDVAGFMEHKGKNCLCTGWWKVYGNEEEARKSFRRFQKCREVYLRLWRAGRPVEQLTVPV